MHLSLLILSTIECSISHYVRHMFIVVMETYVLCQRLLCKEFVHATKAIFLYSVNLFASCFSPVMDHKCFVPSAVHSALFAPSPLSGSDLHGWCSERASIGRKIEQQLSHLKCFSYLNTWKSQTKCVII